MSGFPGKPDCVNRMVNETLANEGIVEVQTTPESDLSGGKGTGTKNNFGIRSGDGVNTVVVRRAESQ